MSTEILRIHLPMELIMDDDNPMCDPLGIEALRKAEADRALLAQMAATILAGYIANPTEAGTYAIAVEDARGLLAEIDKEPAR